MSLLDSRLRASVVLAGFIVGIVACASGQRSIAATPPSAPPQTATVATDVPNLYEDQRQVDEYIRSGRYDKDVAKVIAAARAWLEERAKTAVKPAIVLDIDETSLSNWPAYRVNGGGASSTAAATCSKARAVSVLGKRLVNRRRSQQPWPSRDGRASLEWRCSSSVPVLRICARLQNVISGSKDMSGPV